jgi:nucleotide-binding universal stress UspA family protein
MIETVLIASDGSEGAAAAERVGLGLAKPLGARVRGLTVIETARVQSLRVAALGVTPPALDAIEGFLKARADAVCQRLSERARTAGVEAEVESVSGAADDRIVERGEGADLIVVGRDGENQAWRTGLIGPTADAVLRKTSRPCVVVPPGAELVGPLLLAFDGSPGSVIAARLAVEIGTRLGASVHVFVDSKDKGRAAARFEEVRKLLGNLAVPGRETSSTLGRPDVKIVDAARAVHAGLIVMGAFARNRIHEYFLGSNAAAVVRTSPVAVLLAR